MGIEDRIDRQTALREVESVTPSDTTDLPGAAARALYVGVSGNVALIPRDGEAAVTLNGLAAGVWHHVAARRILATGTTATGILIGR